MADIDVTDLLSDSTIAGQAFTVLRRREIVNPYGESTIVTSELPAVGAVSPTGDNSLIRQEAFETQSNSIQVVTRFPLIGPSKDGSGNNYQPDIIRWEGSYFVVRVLNDFSSFGRGFVVAECVSIRLPEVSTTGPGPGMDFSNPLDSQYAGVL